MAPKKKGGKAPKGKTKEENDEMAVAHVRTFLKTYATQSAALGVDLLPLPISADCAGAFARMVVHPQLGGPLCTPSHVRAITEALALSGYSHLLALALWNVAAHDDGIAHVATFLQSNRSVVVCELLDCGFGISGCKALGEALERNATLTRLSLDNNNIGDAGVEALGTSIRFNRALTSVSLAYCGISSDGGLRIAEGVLRVASLTALELRSNALGPAGVTAVLQVVARHSALGYIGLADTGFGIEAEVHAALQLSVQGNPVCHSYDLRGNPIGDGHAYTYAKLLRKEAAHVISFQVSELIDPPLFKQLLDTAANNKKEHLKKTKKGKKKGGKGKGKKKK